MPCHLLCHSLAGEGDVSMIFRMVQSDKRESKEEYKNMLSKNEISLCWYSIYEMRFCDTIYVLLKKKTS